METCQNGRVSPRKPISDGGKTPNRPSQSPDQFNKDNRAGSSQQLQKPTGPHVPHGQISPLPSGNREQQQQLGSGHGQSIQDHHQSQPSTASAQAPNIDSHIAKAAKFVDQNFQGTIADRHSLPLKIDEDIEPPEEFDIGEMVGDMPS